MSAGLGEPESAFTFLSLEETDRISGAFRSAFQGSAAARAAALTSVSLEKCVSYLSGCNPSGESFLILTSSSVVGALVLQVEAILAHARELLAIDVNGLAVALRPDGSAGFIVDRLVDANERESFDLFVWGMDQGPFFSPKGDPSPES